MRLFPPSSQQPEPESYLIVLDDDERLQEATQAIPYHCGWCQPAIPGATTGICDDCEKKYFPRKGGK